MAPGGQRFYIDPDEVNESGASQSFPFTLPFVADIKEKPTSAPEAPSFKSNNKGFPAHKKRLASKAAQRLPSPPKSQAGLINDDLQPGSDERTQTSSPSRKTVSFADSEREQIDYENEARIAAMSQEEIEEEQMRLREALPPTLLERFLRKAVIENNPGGFDDFNDKKPPQTAFSSETETNMPIVSTSTPIPFNPQTSVGEDKEETSQVPHRVHFPAPSISSSSALDPDSDTFLEDLHAKYYPNLAHDASKLSWMQQPKDPSSYSPSASSVSPSQLRFSFTGQLLPPSLASEIPVTKGLHHHADAPDAAGYTIPELSHLARSTVAAQRCIAYITLGRILYRLGKGEWEAGDIGESLEDIVKKEKVIEILLAATKEPVNNKTEAGLGGERHLSARTYAIEAVWLWKQASGFEVIEESKDDTAGILHT
jgi:hypothetical protein